VTLSRIAGWGKLLRNFTFSVIRRCGSDAMPLQILTVIRYFANCSSGFAELKAGPFRGTMTNNIWQNRLIQDQQKSLCKRFRPTGIFNLVNFSWT